MSMFQPTTIEELIENALVSLGQGVIEVNVSEPQKMLAAQKAIQMYVDYHYDATEHVYVAQSITPDDIENNFLETPPEIHQVIRVLGVDHVGSVHRASTSVIQGGSAVSAHMGSSFSNSRSTGFVDGPVAQASALTTFYLAEAHRSFFNKIIWPNIPITWNKGSKRIRFKGDIRQAAGCGNKVVVYEARVVNANLKIDCDGAEQSEPTCFYDNEWLKEYTAARIQLAWGQNMTKFTNIPLTTGFDFNGDAILQSAKENIARLEEELIERYSLPPTMIIG